MAKAELNLLFLLVVFGCLAAPSEAHHKIHTVGGSIGWKIPPNANFYEEWAKNETFIVGDKLVFLYPSELQNVVEVSTEDDFAQCKQENVIDVQISGSTTLELTTVGPHYYYSGVGLHCEEGQKLKINVTAAAPPLYH